VSQWTEALDAQLTEMITVQGMTSGQAAKLLGIKRGSVASHIYNLGLERPTKRLCCPICDSELPVTEHLAGTPWKRSQELLMMRMLRWMTPSAVGRFFGIDADGIVRKRAQIRRRMQ
jgi:hypothetical protein